MVRGYDTSQLFREGTLRRIQRLHDEIAASRRRMDRVENEIVAVEERIRRLKKKFRLIDSPKPGDDDPDYCK